jgi:hypothetical protein
MVDKSVDNDIGGKMPEDLPNQPSIQPLLDEKKRKATKFKKLHHPHNGSFGPQQGSMF